MSLRSLRSSVLLAALACGLVAPLPVAGQSSAPPNNATRQMQTVRIVSVTVTPNRIRAGTSEKVRVVINITAGEGRTGTVSLSQDAPLALAEVSGLGAGAAFDGTESLLEASAFVKAKKPGKFKIKAFLANYYKTDGEATAEIEIY